MKELPINQMYRIQSNQPNANPYLNKECPVKRVVVSDTGKIVFNPNSHQFIYFSRSQKHHCYYIFNKVLKIITSELQKASQDPAFAKLDLPKDFRAFTYHSNTCVDIIKRVKDFFSNYIPPKYIELVTLNYLNAFSRMMDDCSIHNVKKSLGNRCPEIADTSLYGGAYGVNDAWLDLLKCCTLSTETARLSVESFLDFLIDNACKTVVTKERLKQVLSRNQNLFQVLERVTYRDLQNPDFYSPNNANNIRNYLQAIEDYKLFNDQKPKNSTFFTHQKQIFKDQLHMIR